MRTTQSSEALTFTSIFPGWQLSPLFYLHFTLCLLLKRWQNDGGGGDESKKWNMVAMVVGDRRAGD